MSLEMSDEVVVFLGQLEEAESYLCEEDLAVLLAARTEAVLRWGGAGFSQDDGNAGFEYLANEEQYQSWIMPFDQPIGYVSENGLSNANSPLDFVSLFLSDDFWNLFVTETNRYVHQYLVSHQLQPHSRYHQWSDVTVSEMKAFFSM